MADRRIVEDMPEVRVRPLRRAEYDVLVEQGLLTEHERIELLDGELVAMSPQNAPHAGIVEALNERLMPALAGEARVRVQLPFAAGEHSEPEPDIAIVPTDEHRDRHPERSLLIIEVADASVRLDQGERPGRGMQNLEPDYYLAPPREHCGHPLNPHRFCDPVPKHRL